MKNFLLTIIYSILKLFAKIYLFRTKPYVIWITWSVWKTSSRMIIQSILSKYSDKNIYTSSKNFNSEIGIVLSIFTIEKFRPWIFNIFKLIFVLFFKCLFQPKKYDIIVLEYWVDKPKDMDFLLSVVKPDISVFTRLDYIHAENFKDSIYGIYNEKIKLIKQTKDIVYINCSDKRLKKYSSNIDKVCFYDIDDYDYINENNKIYSIINYNNKKIKTNLLWNENFSYVILGFNILYKLWYTVNEKNLYIDLPIQKWRFSVLKWIKNSIIIDSSYNAWPESMKKMIQNSKNIQKIYKDHKLMFVLWDMRELWDNSKNAHKEILDLVKGEKVITLWKEFNKYASYKNFNKSIELWDYLKNLLEKSNDTYIILFKWSQNTIFLEEAIKKILNDDYNKLPRQEDFFINKKNEFFNSF